MIISYCIDGMSTNSNFWADIGLAYSLCLRQMIVATEKYFHILLHYQLYTPHCWTQASSQSERTCQDFVHTTKLLRRFVEVYLSKKSSFTVKHVIISRLPFPVCYLLNAPFIRTYLQVPTLSVVKLFFSRCKIQAAYD